MIQRCFGLVVVVLMWTFSVCAQGTIEKGGVSYPTEEQVAGNKRIYESLKHPTFITLRLQAMPRDLARGKPTDTPAPYKVRDLIEFQLLMTQNSFEKIIMANLGVPQYEYRPELIRDGDVVPFTKEAQSRAERYERAPPNGSNSVVTLEPGHEYVWSAVKLEDWYEPLGTGHYQLIVRKRFAPDGDWTQSNPVIFDIEPRNPAPIPAGVTVEMLPQDFQEQPGKESYALRNDVNITVFVSNPSEQRIAVEVIESYYANRLRLFKDGVLVPYREEIQKLIQSREEALVGGVDSLFLEPHTRGLLQGLNLTTWYGPLAPGHYKLVNRRRFEIDGPWTADSLPLIFEVLPPK